MDDNSQARSKEEEKARIRKRIRNGNADNADYIPAKEIPQIFDSDKEMKVAVYARVSTLSTQQTSSQAMQEEYYADFVERQGGWKLVGIYADEGISGTSISNRNEFVRMIADCRRGGIDLIVVKSVSRFSRNVKDGIASIEELAELKPPVGVWFENERIYSLSSDNNFLLNLAMSVAAEESRVKSVAMNSSLKMRLSHGILLTPPLLGYDYDDTIDNLVINENEAPTVRLAFCMYLRGYTTGQIAETFMTLGLLTKPGNTKWTAGAILGILQNERHCGQVLTWKNFTQNYKNHKLKKNRNDRDQYRYHNHHPAIVSESDFNAVGKLISNAKFGARSFMPELRVMSGGLLHGFVSVNPRWMLFSPDDYRAASESAGSAENVSGPAITAAHAGDIDWRGYEIVRSQFITAFNAVSLTLNPNRIRVVAVHGEALGAEHEKLITLPIRMRISGACIRRFGDSEYAELLVHPDRKLIAVRTCSREYRNAVRWAYAGDDKLYSRDISGAAFGDKLYALFGVCQGMKYRFRGVVTDAGGETIALFDMGEPEILTEDGIVFPEEWGDSFGDDYYVASESAHTLMKNGVAVAEMSEYNTLPDIKPTPSEELSENHKTLLALLQRAENELEE
jgi:DNA invertase Pin-like site-specific DNA recombinase